MWVHYKRTEIIDVVHMPHLSYNLTCNRGQRTPPNPSAWRCHSKEAAASSTEQAAVSKQIQTQLQTYTYRYRHTDTDTDIQTQMQIYRYRYRYRHIDTDIDIQTQI